MKRTKLQNYAEYFGLKLLVFIVCFLRRPLSYFFGEIGAWIIYYFIPIRKKQVLENISLSFPEKTKSEVNLIARNTYRNFMRVFIDVLFIPKMSDSEIEKALIYDDSLIKKTLSKGNGLILVSAHFGNWELLALAFSKKYPLSVIAAKQSNDFVNKFISNFREKKGFGVTSFQKDNKMSFRHIIKILRKNRIIALLGDQDAGDNGVFLPFFGRLASTPKGPAFFAIHTGSSIITAFGIYQKNGSINLKLEEIHMPNTGNKEKDIEIINSVYNKRLEAAIIENPEQWFWFHRRWNTHPK